MLCRRGQKAFMEISMYPKTNIETNSVFKYHGQVVKDVRTVYAKMLLPFVPSGIDIVSWYSIWWHLRMRSFVTILLAYGYRISNSVSP